MDKDAQNVIAFLQTAHPYDVLSPERLRDLAGQFSRKTFQAGQVMMGYT